MKLQIESEDRISFTDLTRDEALVLYQLVNQSDEAMAKQLNSTFIDMHFEAGEAQEIGEELRDFIMEQVREHVE